MEPYQQLVEGELSTEEAVSASLLQDEASELEYRAKVAGLRDRWRASSLPRAEVAGASLTPTASGAVLPNSAPAPPLVFTFRAPQLELPLFSDNSQNEFAFSEFKRSFNNVL